MQLYHLVMCFAVFSIIYLWSMTPVSEHDDTITTDPDPVRDALPSRPRALGTVPLCGHVYRQHGDVATVSYSTTWTVMRWNYFTVAPLHCGTGPDGSTPAPCCGGGDFVRASVSVESNPTKVRGSGYYVSTTDNGDGSYTFGVFPVFRGPHRVMVMSSPIKYIGVSMFQQPWRTNVRVKQAYANLPRVMVDGVGGLDDDASPRPDSARLCGPEDLASHGVWLQGPGVNHTYYLPERRCRLRPSWSGEDVRRCLHHRNVLFNGDSTLVEMATAVQSKLYDNFHWGRMAFEPSFRQFDAVHTNANEVLTSDDTPGSTFRMRLAHFWNGAHYVDGNFQGLRTYDQFKYVELLRNHSSRCLLMSPRHRGNRRQCKTKNVCIVKPMMLISILINETRSPPKCGPDISPSPDFVIIASGMHDFRWMNGSIAEIPVYRALLNSTITIWKTLAPRARIALRVSPVPSLHFRHEHVMTNMMNAVACDVARAHSIVCIDVFPLVFPYADSVKATDGHHWLQNNRVKRREKAYKRALIGTFLGEAYLSTLYTFLCS